MDVSITVRRNSHALTQQTRCMDANVSSAPSNDVAAEPAQHQSIEGSEGRFDAGEPSLTQFMTTQPQILLNVMLS